MKQPDKNEVILAVKNRILSMLNTVTESLDSERNAIQQETKSSAGDKYETQREMLQADIRRSEHQLNESTHHLDRAIRIIKESGVKAGVALNPSTPLSVLDYILDDIELVDWTTTNKFARLWFCEDIHHSSILKLAIKKAIQKSTNWNLSSKLFEDDSNDEKNQFVGFVSSHKKGTQLTSFHIHSFVVFHTDLQKNTIVTCILTEQNHILLNMQDWLLQIMQLIQYPHVSSFSTVITNEFIGEDVYLSQHSMDGIWLWDLMLHN